jgi:hypothetical protein
LFSSLSGPTTPTFETSISAITLIELISKRQLYEFRITTAFRGVSEFGMPFSHARLVVPSDPTLSFETLFSGQSLSHFLHPSHFK